MRPNFKPNHRKLKVGDNVGYAREFLQSVGMFTGHAPRAKGTITAILDLTSIALAEVKWDTPDMPSRVNTNNLARVGSAAWGA